MSGNKRMKTLDEIAIHYQTDRASQFSRTWGKPHDYARHYDKLFSPLRNQLNLKLLEIGSASGEGIQMWLEYFGGFTNKIYGVDNVKDTCEWNRQGQHNRFTFIWGDQSDPTFWACFLVDYGKDWDIIIDDGSHINGDIITSFNHLWPHVKPGGFYAIEDLGVCVPGSMFVNPAYPNHMEWLREKINESQLPGGIDSIYFAKELCVIRKAL